jgi:hypothetical protein
MLIRMRTSEAAIPRAKAITKKMTEPLNGEKNKQLPHLDHQQMRQLNFNMKTLQSRVQIPGCGRIFAIPRKKSECRVDSHYMLPALGGGRGAS